MKIYRKALSDDYVKRIEKLKQPLPFDELFGDDHTLRHVIPMKSEKMRQLIDALESGETNTGTKYKVHMDDKRVFRYVNKDGRDILDPRPMRVGKVVRKELGEEAANQWSVEANSGSSEGKSIILSRSRIDVVRMSDFEGLYSCHAPTGGYFEHALDEAYDGGAIAYVVDNADLESIYRGPDGVHTLQEEEIFADTDRGIRGITPLSRLRVNQYVDRHDEDAQLAIPTTNSYGDSVSGFLDTLTSWLSDRQSQYLDISNIDLSDYQRTGGQYSDTSDSDLMENFFGDNMGVTSDLPHKGGAARLEIWDEEVQFMNESINEDLKFSSIYGHVGEDDGFMYITGNGEVVFRFRGHISKDINMLAQEVFTRIDGVGIRWCGEINNVDFTNENGIATVIFEMYMEDTIQNPDDYESKAQDYIQYERDFYHTDAEILQKCLIDNGYLISQDPIMDWVPYMEEVGKGKESEYDISGDEDEIEFYFHTGIINSELAIKNKEVLRKSISEGFIESIRKNISAYLQQDKYQSNFDFYDKTQAKDETYMDISKVVPTNIDVYMMGTDTIDVQINIHLSEMYALGKNYFDLLIGFKPYIDQDINDIIMNILNQARSNWQQEATLETPETPETTNESKCNWYYLAKMGQISQTHA